MATPISKTILELQLLSGGISCQPVIDYLNSNHPGWNLDTSVDVFTYCEGIRAAGSPWAVTYGIYRALSDQQRLTFLSWGLNKLLSIYTTDDLAEVKNQIADYLSQPSEEKANLLIASASLLSSTHRVESAVKAAAIIVTHGSVTATHLQNLETAIKKGALTLQNTPTLDSVNEILTKLEQIVGIRD